MANNLKVMDSTLTLDGDTFAEIFVVCTAKKAILVRHRGGRDAEGTLKHLSCLQLTLIKTYQKGSALV